MIFSFIRQSSCGYFIRLGLVITFVVSMVITPRAYAQEGVVGLPQPGTMVNLSPAYVPLMITGLTIHPENPLLMDFIVSTGNSGINALQVKKESDRLIKYFLACLTIPENNQWVNLSPYEKQRIIPDDLGQTVLGQDMLAQDYLLKQLTASLIYPEKNLGKNFWNKVYSQARQKFGTTQIPVNTFNKVWILPDSATVYEHKDTVLLVKSHLKVMLDEDYLALSHHADLNTSSVNTLGNQIIRQIILPAIEQEVNKGKNFAQLRQIYHSMILAVWFKNNLKQALLNQVYVDKSKVNGVNVSDPSIKQKIYEQYLEAYKKGVFNYIKEELDQSNQQLIPRKYFSGGLAAPTAAMIVTKTEPQADYAEGLQGDTFRVEGGVSKTSTIPLTAAMVTPEQARAKLSAVGWGDIFDQWWKLLNGQTEKQQRLLSQIESIDWNQAKLLHDNVIVPGVPKSKKDQFILWLSLIPHSKSRWAKLVKPLWKFLPLPKFQIPVKEIGDADEGEARDIARKIVLEAGNTDALQSKFAIVLAAGGTGAEFKSDDPKGYLAGTPLSQIPLYAGMVKKIQAAAKYYHHNKSFPIVVMTSDITHEKTRQFFEENQWFGMKDRIFLAQQGVMPLFDAKTNQPFLNAKGELATGGTGHGDTFDDVLVRKDVSDFLDKFGVEVVQYIAVDNQLNPIADERLIGYGQMTWDPDSKDPRAHIALGVIKKKDRNDRLGNQILVNDKWVTIGYGDASDTIKDAVTMGDPSFRVVWRQSLKDSQATPWRIDKKTQKDFEGNMRAVKKIERASDEKPRRTEGPLVELNREDAFEPIKKPDAVATVETVATSYLAQSNYWKKRLAAVPVSIQTSDKIAVEIAAQEAFYMSNEELAAKLKETGINIEINNWLSNPTRKPYELGGILITEDWKVKFIDKNDPRLYFLNWQDSMIDSPVAPNVDPNIHKGKNMLITGGAGYVAESVLYKALENGSNPVIFDNQLTAERLRILRKIDQAYPGRITIVKGDLADVELLNLTMMKYKIDSVVHLGALIAAGVSVDLPATYYKNNVTNTMNLLDAMNKAGVKNLVFASSAGVFEGKRFNKYGLLDEETPVNPQNPYGETKYLMEVLMQAYAKEHGINYTALRFFNLAGAFYWDKIKEWVGEGHLGPETHLIPRLIKYFLYGKEKVSFQVFGTDYPTPDGTNIRDYIDVLDIGHAIIKSLSAEYQAQLDGHQIAESYTLGTGAPTSNKQIIESFRKVLLKKGRIKKPQDLQVDFGPRRAGDPPVLRASSDKAIKRLAWRARIGLDKIIETAFEFHDQQQKNGSLDLQEPIPEKVTGVPEAVVIEQILLAIRENTTLKNHNEIKAEILLRLLVRCLNPEMEGIKKHYKENQDELKLLYKVIAEKKGGLYDLISTNGFVSAINQKRELVAYLIKVVKEDTAAKYFGDDPNNSRLHIAQALEALLQTVMPPAKPFVPSAEVQALVKKMVAQPLPQGKGFESVQAVAQGNVDIIRKILDSGISDRDPLKPWIAQAFFSPAALQTVATLTHENEKYGEVTEHFRIYYMRLVAATEDLVHKGSMSFDLNVRTDKEGYSWGPSAKYSDILGEYGFVDPDTGKVLKPEALAKLGLTPDSKVSERWFLSDDTKYPSWVSSEGLAIPLFWILHQSPKAVLGQEHYKVYNEALGEVGKILNAAEPLSWQVHLGITEGYLVLKMGKGAGLFLGVNEPKSDSDRREMIASVKKQLTSAITIDNPKIVRIPKDSGVEVSDLFKTQGLQGLVNGIQDSWRVVDLVKYLLIEGRNVVDVGGLGLVQFISPNPGDRLITNEGAPHALFGQGDTRRGMFIEFKATSTGPAYNRESTSDQTWALADNLNGKKPRSGKVLKKLLEQALEAINIKGFWRWIRPEDYKHHGGNEEQIGSKGSYTILHREKQYAGLRYKITPTETLRLNRFDQHSAIVIRQGSVVIKTLDGHLLGTYNKGQEILIAADKGDLLLTNNSDSIPLEMIDLKRPVEGVSLPQLVDPAMIIWSRTSSADGGIDLNSKILNLQREGDVNAVQNLFTKSKQLGLLVASFRRGDFSGVKFEIIDVVPVNLMPLLGFKEE